MSTSLRWRPRGAESKPARTLQILIAVVVLAALAAGWFGWSWWSAAHDDDLAVATKRDTVLREATAALVTLNTVDYRTAKRDIGEWVAVSTGRFGKELAEQRGQQIQRVKKAQIVATATVVDAAVTEMHPRKDTARVMAVLDIEVRSKDNKQQTRHSLIEARLVRAEQDWKVKSVQAAR